MGFLYSIINYKNTGMVNIGKNSLYEYSIRVRIFKWCDAHQQKKLILMDE
jgi:hypothetical protein